MLCRKVACGNLDARIWLVEKVNISVQDSLEFQKSSVWFSLRKCTQKEPYLTVIINIEESLLPLFFHLFCHSQYIIKCLPLILLQFSENLFPLSELSCVCGNKYIFFFELSFQFSYFLNVSKTSLVDTSSIVESCEAWEVRMNASNFVECSINFNIVASIS